MHISILNDDFFYASEITWLWRTAETFTYQYKKFNDDLYPASSKEKIEQQIKILKNHKSSSEDSFQGGSIKHADRSMIKSIYLNKGSIGRGNLTNGLENGLY